MKPLTDKQKKAAWIIAAIILAVHFAPTVLRTVLVTAATRRQSIPAAVPARPGPVPPVAPVMPAQGIAALSPQQQATFLGVWEGSQISADNDNCKVHLELRLNPDQPDHVSGYEARSCINIDKFTLQPTFKGGVAGTIRDSAPVATVMTGMFADGALTFQVDKTVGSSPFVCPLASYTVTPFGSKAIVASWRAVDCPAGQMVLTRAGG